MIKRPPGVRAKVVRAEKHLAALRFEVGRYLKRKPYVIEAEFEPNPPGYWAVARLRKSPPDPIACIAGDAIQNTRIALDHLARGLVLSAGGTPVDKRIKGTPATAFPITNNVNAKGVSITGGVSPQALAEVKAVQPLNRPDHPLYRLAEFSNIDKHRLLLPTPLAITGHAITCHQGTSMSSNVGAPPARSVGQAFPPSGPAPPPPVAVHTPTGVLEAIKDEAKIAFFEQIGPVNGKVSMDGDLTTLVALEPMWPGANVVEVIDEVNHLLTHVRDVVLPRFDRFFA